MQAIAAADAQCDTNGNAYGCASAWAYAEAWAEAVAEANAEAWAGAINKCNCQHHDQIAEANADGHANAFKELVVSVKADASADVCSSGNGHASVSARAECTQNLYSNVFALVRNTSCPLPVQMTCLSCDKTE